MEQLAPVLERRRMERGIWVLGIGSLLLLVLPSRPTPLQVYWLNRKYDIRDGLGIGSTQLKFLRFCNQCICPQFFLKFPYKNLD
jgi:hypothetical protein